MSRRPRDQWPARIFKPWYRPTFWVAEVAAKMPIIKYKKRMPAGWQWWWKKRTPICQCCPQRRPNWAKSLKQLQNQRLPKQWPQEWPTIDWPNLWLVRYTKSLTFEQFWITDFFKLFKFAVWVLVNFCSFENCTSFLMTPYLKISLYFLLTFLSCFWYLTVFI